MIKQKEKKKKKIKIKNSYNKYKRMRIIKNQEMDKIKVNKSKG